MPRELKKKKKITCNLHLKLTTSQQVVRTTCSQTEGLNKKLRMWM